MFSQYPRSYQRLLGQLFFDICFLNDINKVSFINATVVFSLPFLLFPHVREELRRAGILNSFIVSYFNESRET